MQNNLPRVQDAYVDVHCHLTDPRLMDQLEVIFRDADQNHIQHFLLGGIEPNEWQRQLKLQNQYPQKILTCFGLHPYWVAKNSDETCMQALSRLENLAMHAFALGELGLDFRSFLTEAYDRHHQMKFFVKQLHIAKHHNKPVVIHAVRAHQEVLQQLKHLHLPRSGIIHAFNANQDIAQRYLDLGFMLSIGGQVTYPNNHSLQEVVRSLPLESILIESDSPDQKPSNWQHSDNWPSSIISIAEHVAKLRKQSPQQVLEASKQNFLRLFGSELTSRF